MKKTLAVLLAVLICVSAAAFAEEAAIEVAPDESYVETELGGGCAVTRLPADWIAVDAEYADENSKLLGAYTNADGTAMVIVTETKVDNMSDAAMLCAEAVEAGLACELTAYNENPFVEITAEGEDGHIVRMANYLADENTIIAFTFSCAKDAQDAMQSVICQALAGFAVK